jgi:hypothetical protein
MINQILIVFSVVISMLFSGKSSEVVLESNIPDSMTAGEEVVARIDIKKGEVAGYAKLQIEIPDGLVFTPMDSKLATFSFTDGKAKYLWLNLPEDNEFAITFKLTASPTASGSHYIKGSFSYLVDNEKFMADLPEKNIEIAPKTIAAAVSSVITTNTSSESTATEVTMNVVSSEPSNVPVKTVPTEKLKVKEPSKKLEVKEPSKKIELKESNTAVVSTDANTIYKVQLGAFDQAVPQEIINVIMALPDVTSHALSNNFTAYAVGSYSNMEEAKARRDKFISLGLEDASLGMVKNDVYTPLRGTGGVRSVAKAGDKAAVASAATGDKNSAGYLNAPHKAFTDASLLNEDGGNEVIFRIQLGAFSKSPDKTAFSDVPNLIVIKSEDGFVRVLSGSFNNYQAALKEKESLVSKGYAQAYVVAFKSGKKVNISSVLASSN